MSSAGSWGTPAAFRSSVPVQDDTALPGSGFLGILFKSCAGLVSFFGKEGSWPGEVLSGGQHGE